MLTSLEPAALAQYFEAVAAGLEVSDGDGTCVGLYFMHCALPRFLTHNVDFERDFERYSPWPRPCASAASAMSTQTESTRHTHTRTHTRTSTHMVGALDPTLLSSTSFAKLLSHTAGRCGGASKPQVARCTNAAKCGEQPDAVRVCSSLRNVT